MDTGVLISVDRDEEHSRVFLTAAHRAGESLHTSEAVVAQVWRDGARQARLASVLKGLHVHPLDDGRAVGRLLAMAGGADVVDAHLVVLGAVLCQPILTGDAEDLRALAAPIGRAGPAILSWP
ncbi:MAG: twitching motility protein PilT [Euzebya sp.]